MASAEVWRTLPKMTWPTAAGSTPERSSAARPVRTPERRTTPVSRGEDMIPKYTSDHGAVPDHRVLGDDHDPVADVVVGTVEKGGLPGGRDSHVVSDPRVLVDDRP